MSKKDQSSGKKCGHEIPGVLLCLLCFLVADNHQYELQEDNMMGEHHGKYVMTFDCLLLLEEWVKQDQYTKEDLDSVEDYLPHFMDLYTETIERTEGMGMKFVKFHLLKHIIDTIRRYGALRNVYGGIGETMLKFKAKETARKTNMSAPTFEVQTALRDVESVAIDRATHEVAKVHNDSIIHKLHPDYRKAREPVLTESDDLARDQDDDDVASDRGRTLTVRWDGDSDTTRIVMKKGKWDDVKEKKWGGALSIG